MENQQGNNDAYINNVMIELENIPISRKFIILYTIYHTILTILPGFYMDTHVDNIVFSWFIMSTCYNIWSVSYKIYLYNKGIRSMNDYGPCGFLLEVFLVILVLSGMGIFYFLGANYKAQIPALYTLGITITSCYLIIIFRPIIRCLATCLCFPCIVYIVLHMNDRRGASDNNLSLIPIRTYTNVIDGELCCICGEEYKVNDTIKTLYCRHEFHSICIDKWLKINPTCPYCRHEISNSNV